MKVFRETPGKIFEDLKRRKISDEVANKVIEYDKQWREFIEEGNQLRAQRNSISREIGELKKKGKDAEEILQKMSGVKEKLLINENKAKEMLKLRDDARMRVPNILGKEVPVGDAEEGNIEISLHGPEKKKDSKPHQEI